MNARDNITRFGCLGVLMLLSATAGVAAAPATLGWLENAYLQPWGVRVKTKLDTGARTSSIDATDIEPFTRGDASWVRFVLRVGKNQGHDDGIAVERPVVRQTLVKEHGAASVPRYVVTLPVCVADDTFEIEVTLVDRANFNYLLLLGRAALKGRFRVDAARKFTSGRRCERAAPGSD